MDYSEKYHEITSDLRNGLSKVGIDAKFKPASEVKDLEKTCKMLDNLLVKVLLININSDKAKQ